jgi:capsid protein
MTPKTPTQAQQPMLTRLWNWVGGLFGVQNFHEAGQRWQTSRSTIPGSPWPGDARYDDLPAEKAEVLRKARYFEINAAIVNRLASVWEQYVVGAKGLVLKPASSDKKWNAAAKARFVEIADSLDLAGDTFVGFQAMAARRWFIDGEVFILKTKSAGPRPDLRIQLIECHRVQTPPDLFGGEGKTIFDGIERDAGGKPLRYWVREGSGYSPKLAENVIHLCDPDRPGTRAFSYLDSVLNDIHDLDDLQIFEMKAAKDAAEISNVLQTESGEISAEGLRKQHYKLGTQNTIGTETTEDRVKQIRHALGGRTIALKLNEKIEQFRSDRPGVAMQGYWDYLTAKICVGSGISKLLVFPGSMQGTVVRADLDIAATFFACKSAVMASCVVKIFTWAIEWDSRFQANLADKPADWRKVRVLPPRSVNVDIGRNSTAMLAQLEAGACTMEMIYSPQGEDWEEQIDQRAYEEAVIDQAALKHNVSPDRIRKAISESLKLTMQLDAGQQAAAAIAA